MNLPTCLVCSRPILPGEPRVSWFAKDESATTTERGAVHLFHLGAIGSDIAVAQVEKPESRADRRTTCRAGHQLTPENVKWNRNGGRPQRICIECYEVRYRRRWGHRPFEAVQS